ncbi:uncharacterized protein LOC120295491 [Eucalyptus grandis]|uniref:uncharacterized protein LOC120295491 n=1 Tax=Eucalyptus grandis TaxID=71139 RepID=UPI00192E9286|nr:uncharacterized protein LOC120295491 [Eucalyptus grandis]
MTVLFYLIEGSTTRYSTITSVHKWQYKEVRLCIVIQYQCIHLRLGISWCLHIPTNPILRIGNSLEFSLEGFKVQVTGQGTSANESVIAIDLLSGKTKAAGEGIT